MEGQRFSGGIIIAWKKNNVNLGSFSNAFSILHVKIILQGGGILRFTPLYTSPNEGNIL